MTVFTLTYRDFLDFERCPKIVAYQAYLELKRLEAPPLRTRASTISALTGQVGEAAFEAVFADDDEDEVGEGELSAEQLERQRQAMERWILRRLARFGPIIDGEVERLVGEAAEAMLVAREKITSVYGNLKVLGRGESHNGGLPARGYFDFVALPERSSTPVIVEVKNLRTPKPRVTHFQAAYYNALARRFGVMVLTDRIENGAATVAPVPLKDTPAETLIVDARYGQVEVVRDQADLSSERINAVWTAKQLGYTGRAPETNCLVTCPHVGYGLSLPPGNLEPAAPLPLAMAQAALDTGGDLDLQYYKMMLKRTRLGVPLRELRFSGRVARARGRGDLADLAIIRIAEAIGLDPERFLEVDTYIPPSISAIEREIPGALTVWRKLVGRKRLKKARPAVAGASRGVYSLPSGSKSFVRDSGRTWK